MVFATHHPILCWAILALASPCLAQSATNRPPLRSVAAFHALSDAETAARAPFEIRGQVTFVNKRNRMVVADETGAMAIDPAFELTDISTGDVISVSGTTRLPHTLEHFAIGERFAVLGRAPLPAPVEATEFQLSRGNLNYRRVHARGIILDAFKDEIDQSANIFLLRSGSDSLVVALIDWDFKEERLPAFIGTEVDVIGVCMPLPGDRKFSPPHIGIADVSDITLVSAPLADINQTAPLEIPSHASSRLFPTRGRRRITGSVLATWQDKDMLVETDSGHRIHATLARGTAMPPVSARLDIVGIPDADNFSVSMKGCLYATLGQAANASVAAEVVSGNSLMIGKSGKREINYQLRDRFIRIDGTITSLPSQNDSSRYVRLESDGFTIPIDISSNPEILTLVTPGCRVTVTGYCILQPAPWSYTTPFQRITGLFVVPRSALDVVILSHPPWLTVQRLLFVIGSLLALIVGIFIRNRRLNRLVESRSRELMREEIAHAKADLKVEERTRLAVELHDTLSQNITGVALQIEAAQTAAEKDPASVLPYLETTRRKMQNCRDNLRNCLWDLRSRALEEDKLGDAIRKTVAHHLGTARAEIKCDVLCRWLSDNTIHAVLCIFRELTINAIRHGNATRIAISGKEENGRLFFSVHDNGCGFDLAMRPGISEGHFGLQGVDERIRRLGGSWRIDSSPGNGCTVALDNLCANN